MSLATIVDLSQVLEPEMQIYPGDSPFSCIQKLSVADHGCSVHLMSLGSHTGGPMVTAYRQPATLPDAARSKRIDEIPLSTFVGPALVVDLTSKGPREVISWDDLAPYADRMHEGVILLLHTGWSSHWKTPKYYDHPFLARGAAEHVISTGIRVLGVDTLSPDETRIDGSVGELGWAAHEVILGSGGIIAENLANLEAIVDKEATVSLMPLDIRGCDGSPIRAYASVVNVE
ncbi:hypothetical protein HWV62_43985 [Athelia sp. TMB]|nr:hypothetical protein HWV62_43985 [Athelia sp. TMB]